MKGYVILLLLIGLSAKFIPAHGLKCYECSWHDTECNGDKVDVKAKTTSCPSDQNIDPKSNDIPSSPVGDTTETITTIAPESSRRRRGAEVLPERSHGGSVIAKYSEDEDSKNWFCYMTKVKSGELEGWERGCKKDDDRKNCPFDKSEYPDAKGEDCEVCQSDECNKNSSFAVQGIPVWALLMYVAATKMFTVAK